MEQQSDETSKNEHTNGPIQRSMKKMSEPIEKRGICNGSYYSTGNLDATE